MEERKGNSWLKRLLDFVNPLRDPSLMVAAVLTFIEEAGNRDPWYMIIILALVNWLAVRGIVWLVVNFTFASTFLIRRFWWAMKHPRLAWRILDAVGHEEIVIGGLPSEGVLLQDGTAIMGPMLGASGIQVIGELPAGTEIPMLGFPNPNGQMGQFTTDGQNMHTPGFFPGAGSFANVNGFGNQGMGNNSFGNNNYVSTQSTDGLPRSFPQRSSEEEERLRQQLATYSRLLDDWIQFTEEKWRTISDGQLGWKPLRGRWSDWDDIFQDVYAAKTSDPMAEAAQAAGAATSRRFDSSREKGSAASAVACFMRDMMTLRQGLDILQGSTVTTSESSSTNIEQQPTPVPPLNRPFGGMNSGNLGGGTTGSFSPRSTLIRRPAQIFVDADSEK